jgi:hypothetical protein
MVLTVVVLEERISEKILKLMTKEEGNERPLFGIAHVDIVIMRM